MSVADYSKRQLRFPILRAPI